MPDWSRRDFLRAAAALAVAVCVSGAAIAEGLQLVKAELSQKGEMWELSGGYDLQLSTTLEDALKRGVQLSFVQEFELDRPWTFWMPNTMTQVMGGMFNNNWAARTFWPAEGIARLSRVISLSYNALLRQYFVTVSGHSKSFTTLVDALDHVADFDDWAVLNQSQVQKRQHYRAAVHMYLNVSQLPKPLQVNAVGSQRWQLDSGWWEWSFIP